MKIKTSISVDEEVLSIVQEIARQDDRSVSYVLEKFIMERAQELPEPSKKIAPPPQATDYRAKKKRARKK